MGCAKWTRNKQVPKLSLASPHVDRISHRKLEKYPIDGFRHTELVILSTLPFRPRTLRSRRPSHRKAMLLPESEIYYALRNL